MAINEFAMAVPRSFGQRYTTSTATDPLPVGEVANP